MARVECHHNIAHCILTPVASDGNPVVHCKLGGDVTGETTMEYDPVAIQGWIRSTCGLTCFSFDSGFAILAAEMDAVLDMLEREHNAEEMQSIRKRFTDGMDDAREERRTWKEQREHEEMKWRCSEYTLETEEVGSYCYNSKWG